MANYSPLIRRPWETGFTAFKRATTYARIKDGTYPPPVKIGRMSAWIDREMVAVDEALIAGRSDVEIRQLVTDLVAKRTAGFEGYI
jgi:prophage regulatory protein